ncbi:MAG: helix-turn-helix transcriptional regulator [Burkholderiales bacterium]
MLEILGDRQKQLLKLLLKNKSGLTADELSSGLKITRNAVRQHLAALQSDGLIALGSTRPSGGRPQQLYALTEKGKEIFPRHYSWFAQLVLEAVKREHGAKGLSERLASIGSSVAAELRTQSPGLETREQKVEKLAAVMDELGYSARRAAGGDKAPVIEADNCVFHELAIKNPEICDFDLAMMGTFTDSKVDHQECMARGGNVCRFRFTGKK